MLKKLFIPVLLFTGVQVMAQAAFKPYEQAIDGTNLTFKMLAIPGGSFKMGTTAGGKEDEKPAHDVKLDPFWIGQYEVTWDLFEPFLYKDYEIAKSKDGKVSPEIDAVTRPTKP